MEWICWMYFFACNLNRDGYCTMFDNQKRAFIATTGTQDLCILPMMANRHGLITGATGTGKTVTLQTMAETFSQMGVPVFAADVKGDLCGVAAQGGNKESVVKRVKQYGLDAKGFAFQAFPVQLWDVFGESGTPVRATIQDMGAMLLSRLLNLSDTQDAVLSVIFKIAQDEQLEIIDLKDLQKLLEYVANHSDKYEQYGHMSPVSIGAIQRNLAALGSAGADIFFGEPELAIDDIIQCDKGKGIINILASDKLMQSPQLYTTFLLWLMSKLFEVLPEVGDAEKPKLVFFFDEAHLLFKDAPKVLLDKVEQVVRLIRSKGVGIYFISQTPADIPDSVLGQLGNRVQHALRAYTPKDQKALKAAAASFRPNPAFETEAAIAELGTGEALLSFLDEKGAPQPVERAYILPPQGQIGPITPAERKKIIDTSIIQPFYSKVRDRQTAYEILSDQLSNEPTKQELAAQKKAEELARKEAERLQRQQEKEAQRQAAQAQRQAEQAQKYWAGMAKSVVAPLAKQLLGSLFRRR